MGWGGGGVSCGSFACSGHKKGHVSLKNITFCAIVKNKYYSNSNRILGITALCLDPCPVSVPEVYVSFPESVNARSEK